MECKTGKCKTGKFKKKRKRLPKDPKARLKALVAKKTKEDVRES